MPVEISYFAAFIAGLLGGVHCLGMCGGIVGALTFGINPIPENEQDAPPQSPKNIYPYLLAYNGGRLLSYTFAGVLVGGISMLASNLPVLNNIQFGLQIFAALFMIAPKYSSSWESQIPTTPTVTSNSPRSSCPGIRQD